MNMTDWKRILLQWIKQCNLVENDFYSIEQSVIEDFFFKFLQHVAPGIVKEPELSSFLKDHYPQFEAHFDDANALASADYIYVYSLLLHFGCVKYPDKFFHNICKTLRSSAQQCIVIFFQEMVETEVITKDVLRHAIAVVPKENENVCKCSGFNNFDPLESPKRQPLMSTPKSSVIEERTRELYSLRAQLETERYEKSILEMQIKQNEQKIHKMGEEHDKMRSEIHDLKSEIILKTENVSPKHDENDQQAKRRLCKEISKNHDQIAKLSDVVNLLKEEKSNIKQKLKYSEKQILGYVQKIEELDCKVNELIEEIKIKNQSIQTLTETKTELEQIVMENRGKNSMDSSDWANSSSSGGSPENLGCGVIDVKLRETEIENSKLRDELYLLRNSNEDLAKHICNLTNHYANILNITPKDQITNCDNNVTEVFYMFTSYVDKLISYYQKERNCNTKLQHDLQTIQTNNVQLKNRIKKLEDNNSEMKLKVDTLSCELCQCKKELNQYKKENKKLCENNKELQQENCCYKKAKDKELSEMESLNCDVAQKCQLIDKLIKENEKLKESEHRANSVIQKLNINIKQTRERSEKEKRGLNETLCEVNTQQVDLSKKYEKLIAEYDKLKKEPLKVLQDVEECKEQLYAQISELTDENKEQAAEIERMRQLTMYLKQNIITETRLSEFKLKNEVQRLNQNICNIEISSKKLSKENCYLKTAIAACEKDFENQKIHNDLLSKKNSELIEKIQELEISLEKKVKESVEMETSKLLDEFNTSRDEYNKELFELKNKLTLLKTENKDLQADLKKAEITISSQITKIDKINREIISLSEINEEKNNFIKNLQEEILNLSANAQKMSHEKGTLECELNQEKNFRQERETKIAELNQEKNKLAENNKFACLRIEKQASQLCEAHAKIVQLEKEFDTLRKIQSDTELHRRELQKEFDCLNERLSQSDLLHKEIASQTEELQKENCKILKEKENLVASELTIREEKKKLEKLRDLNTEKIQKLSKSLCEAKNSIIKTDMEKDRLKLEVGGLNSQIVELKRTNNNKDETNAQLKKETDNLRQENFKLNAELQNVSKRLDVTQSDYCKLEKEINNLRSEFEELCSERDALEQKHIEFMTAQADLKILHESSIADRDTKIVQLKSEIKKLQNELENRNEEISQLNSIRSGETKELKNCLTILEKSLETEKAKSEKLLELNAKLQCKYKELKERHITHIAESEERIKTTRLELEGKLEKMKSKMKSLYNEETTKLKARHDRELTAMQSKFEVLDAQRQKYEERSAKLSEQICILNKNLLESQKQNTFLKLNEQKSSKIEKFCPFTRQEGGACMGPMEDEEGEIFNNTYLADLQSGRMSDFMSKNVCAEELLQRNSLLPPHLKSTYAAQYRDHGLTEEELKNNYSIMDDSTSALLSINKCGTRKKNSGSTTYQRPGPPTPSKKAGRSSLGGAGCEATRNVLKSHDNTTNSISISLAKTPSNRYTMFPTRLTIKDEPRNSLRKSVYKRRQLFYRLSSFEKHGVGACSSTPRKSIVHRSPHKRLDSIMSSAISSLNSTSGDNFELIQSTSTYATAEKDVDIDVPIVPTTISKHSDGSEPKDSGNVSPDISSHAIDTISRTSSKGFSVKSEKNRRRVSIYSRTVITSKSQKALRAAFREQNKIKAKNQRYAEYNQHRKIVPSPRSTSSDVTPNSKEENISNVKQICNDLLSLQSKDEKQNQISISVTSANNDNINKLYTKPKNNIENNEMEELHKVHLSPEKHFQQILDVKESSAPFQISDIQFNLSPQQSSSTMLSKDDEPVAAYNSTISTIGSQCSSHTVYGRSIIYNRKIPIADRTSIAKPTYIRKCNSNDVVMINQTIRLRDFYKIWKRMSVMAKGSFIFASFASIAFAFFIILKLLEYFNFI